MGNVDGGGTYPRFVSLLERDIREMVTVFPKLSRAEVRMAIEGHGPERAAVERELERLSKTKSGA
jgi:hypothetical protein